MLAWTLFPFWWAIALSIKRPADFFTAKVLPFVQFRPTLENWTYEWRAFWDPVGLGNSLLNSILVASASTALCLVLGCLAAYWFAKLAPKTWPRRRMVLLLGVVLLPRLIPPVITALPYSAIIRDLGLEDTALALIVAHTTLNLPIAVVLLASLMVEVPDEWLDAALVDGLAKRVSLPESCCPPLRRRCWPPGPSALR